MRSGNKKFAKKAVCWILSLAMVLAFIPFSSFAADDNSDSDVEAAGLIYNQITLAKAAVEKTVEAQNFWGSVLEQAGKKALIKSKEAVDFAGFIGSELYTKGVWSQWAKWGKLVNSDLPEKLFFWPGVQAYKGFALGVEKFQDIGEDAMQALAGMLLFVPVAAGNAAKQVGEVNEKIGSQSLMTAKQIGNLNNILEKLAVEAAKKAGKQVSDVNAVIGKQALQAAGFSALIAKQIPAEIAKQVKTWKDLENVIKSMKLPYFEGPECTLPDLDWMKALYPDLDWAKVFKLANFNPCDFGLDKITGEWAKIPFEKLMKILKAASQLGTNIDLNKIFPVWDWQGKFPVCDWSKCNFKCWGDMINLDFIKYLKGLKFPIDCFGFKLNIPEVDFSKCNIPGVDLSALKNLVPPCGFMLPTYQTEITSVTAEPVKANDKAIHDGLLENIGGYTLADKDGFVVFDKDGKAKVLYRVVVSGTPGATFSLEDENAKLVFAPLNALGVPVAVQHVDGSIKGYIPFTHALTDNVTLYVAKDYDESDVLAADKYSKYSYLPLHFVTKSNTSLVKVDNELPNGMAYVAGNPVKLIYVLNGGTPEYAPEVVEDGSVVTVDKVPVREGYTWLGWYLDKDCTKPVENGKVKINGDTTIYAGWSVTPVPEWLNGNDHFAYMIGYPDGYVKPGKAITRAEAATIFFRLLKHEYRIKYLTKSNPFNDVKAGSWYNTAVSTLAAMGIIQGRTPTTFAPNECISRAEFITMCTRFDTSISVGSSNLKDIQGTWAEAYINKAVRLGWVGGYMDKTFLPDQCIIRAEVATIINRILHRLPDEISDLLSGMITWPDNTPSDWFYLPMQEATNSHNAKYDTETTEYWTELIANKDWTEYQD